MTNQLKSMLNNQEPAVGLWLNFPSPDLAEFVGMVGFDFIVIDMEHYAFDPETFTHIVRAAKGSGCTPVCRVATNDPSLILNCLEAGVESIIVPHVNTAEEAKAVVRAVKFPPAGIRGANSITRASNYGFTQSAGEFFESANQETLVITMMEDIEGIENLPEILAIDGLDTVFVGPEDLSVSMGHHGQPGHPEVQAVIELIEKQILASGKPLGRLGFSSQAAAQTFADGGNFFVLFFPVFLGQSFQSFLHGVGRKPATG